MTRFEAIYRLSLVLCRLLGLNRLKSKIWPVPCHSTDLLATQSQLRPLAIHKLYWADIASDERAVWHKPIYFALFLPFLLVGCEKRHSLIGGISQSTTAHVAFMGQSNIVSTTGLSASFAAATQAAGKAITPIECAVGGTYLDEWQKGQPLYESCLAEMKKNPPAVIIWWQGEADAHDMALTLTWAARFLQMTIDLRKGLGYHIPIIYVQLGNGPTGEMAGPNWQEMRRQQATASIPNSSMLDVTFAHHLHKINADGNIDVHYTPEGYKAIGKELANVYLGG